MTAQDTPGAAEEWTGDPPPGQWTSDGVGRHLNLAAKASRGFFEQLLAEAGASWGIWSVLAVLDTSGPLIQRDLAERLSIEGPTLTRHIAQMEARGLVTRQRSGADRRVALVELTPKGQQTYERLVDVATECYRQVLRGFTIDEVTLLRSLLIRLQRNAHAAAAARPHRHAAVPTIDLA